MLVIFHYLLDIVFLNLFVKIIWGLRWYVLPKRIFTSVYQTPEGTICLGQFKQIWKIEVRRSRCFKDWLQSGRQLVYFHFTLFPSPYPFWASAKTWNCLPRLLPLMEFKILLGFPYLWETVKSSAQSFSCLFDVANVSEHMDSGTNTNPRTMGSPRLSELHTMSTYTDLSPDRTKSSVTGIRKDCFENKSSYL